MYERSAVVLERYFAQNFYYDEKDKLIKNGEYYRQLIEVLEKYQDVSEAEDKIIKECEDIASQIKQIQKNQGSIYRRTLKLQEERNSLFTNIDESAIELGRQLDKIEKEIDTNNAKMRPIDQEFIDTIAKFNEKSDIRSECGKKRRKIEKEYRSCLERTTKNINDIDKKTISDIKRFIKLEDESFVMELKDIMLKNGEKEKEPFDSNVVENSIMFGQLMYKQEGSILLELYDKTNNLLQEINNNAVKIKKYKKLSKDSKNILDFVNVKKEYLTQFLDNERLSVGLGKKEHKKLMKEACNDFQKDTEQINNLNELLLSEISGDADQNKYDDLYNAVYLIDLQKKEQEFETKLRKLNMVGKILNPINWRIISIEKIYSVFDDIVTNEYQRDLSHFKIGNLFGQEMEADEVEEEEIYEDEYDDDVTEYIEPIKEVKPKSVSSKKEKKSKTKEINEEIEISNDIMSYYDNLDDEEDDDIETEDESEENDDFVEDLYRNLYNADDDFYDDEEEENDIYDDLETILKNRRKRVGRSKIKRSKTSKKKGIFGIGGKKW